MTQTERAQMVARPPSARRTARTLKIIQALVFLGLGGWCRIAPHGVERLSLKPEIST